MRKLEVLLKHFKGTKAMTRGHGDCLYCLHEVGLATNELYCMYKSFGSLVALTDS